MGALTALGAAFAQGGGGTVLPTIMRQVANRVSNPQSQNASFVMGRAGTQHWPAVAINGTVEVSWPLWLAVSGSAGPTNGGAWEYATGAATATAQITYTDRTTGQPVTVSMIDAVGGTAALSGVSGGEIVATAVIDMMPGTKIKPEIRGSFPSGVIYSQFKSDLAGGDFFEFANTVGALGSAPVQTFADTWYGPCMIRALSNKPVALISGDSREDGIYDVPNTVHGDGGQTARLLGEAGVPYLNLSARGDTAAEFAANTGNSRRRALAAKAGATMIFLGNGINDFSQNRTAAQVRDLNQAIADGFGLEAIWKTCDPFTVGNINTPWTVPGNAERMAYNAIVRAKSLYWDPTEILESASIPGAWVSAEAVYSGEQPSFIHETGIGNKCAAATAAVVGTSVEKHGIAPRASTLPGTITNLAGVAQSQTSILLNYTPVGAGHEYRRDGGAWTAMPSNRIVTGLTAGTTYAFEVRGYSGKGTGPASNTANIATQAAPATTWDPANLAANASLSETNLRLTSAASNQGSRSTSSRSSGKLYAEIEIVAVADGSIGIANASAAINNWLALSGNGLGIAPLDGTVYMSGASKGSAGIGSLANGNILQLKIDRDAGTIQFGKNNTFGSVLSGIPTGALFIAATGNSGLSIRIRTGVTQFSYAVPSGFTAWA